MHASICEVFEKQKMPKVSLSMPPADRFQLKELIDADSNLVLSQLKTFPMLIRSQISLEGTYGKPDITLTLQDPTYAQYATFMNKPKALTEMHIQWGDKPLEPFISPRVSNTKHDLFELALTGKADATFQFLLDLVAPAGTPLADPKGIDFIGLSGHSPLWVAFNVGNWKAAGQLLLRIGTPENCRKALLCPQKVDSCPLVQAFKFGRDTALQELQNICRGFTIVRDTEEVGLLEDAVWYTHWTDDFREDPSGRHLWSVFADPANLKYGIADQLERFAPEEIRANERTGAVPADPLDTPPAPEPQQPPAHCHVEGCENSEGMEKCPTCGFLFCSDHLDDHPCTVKVPA
jgi:hypothetical protein